MIATWWHFYIFAKKILHFMSDEMCKILLDHGIKPTAVRMRVWGAVEHRMKAFALSDLEDEMPEMDRSSIFRSLRLFASHHLLHEIDDGTGKQKYCRCRCEDDGHLNHIHFSCVRCGKTYCLMDYTIPRVDLPEGFVPDDIEYVVKGLCPSCSKG